MLSLEVERTNQIPSRVCLLMAANWRLEATQTYQPGTHTERRPLSCTARIALNLPLRGNMASDSGLPDSSLKVQQKTSGACPSTQTPLKTSRKRTPCYLHEKDRINHDIFVTISITQITHTHNTALPFARSYPGPIMGLPVFETYPDPSRIQPHIQSIKCLGIQPSSIQHVYHA